MRWLVGRGNVAMIPGVDFGEFQNALYDSFTRTDLEMMVRIRMNERLDRIVGEGPLDYIVFQLLSWAERQGTPVVVDLARAAYLDRPRNEQLRRVYEKFGMAPAVSCQHAGASIPGAPERATAPGLEALVRPRLKIVDMDVWRERMAQVEGRICRVELDGNPMGTGFLVNADLVLTNYHVMEGLIEGKASAVAAGCRFDYKVLAEGSRSEGIIVGLHDSDWCVDSSPYSAAEAVNDRDRALPTADELDYAVVRLARPAGCEPVDRSGAPGAPKRGWIEIPEIQQPLEPAMPLVIAQHPDGSPLKLALDTQGIISVNSNGTRVRYATNTANGSSGSPCFNMDWALVALHHMGDPAWTGHIPKFNQGVPIGIIRKRLSGKVEFQKP
jgi:hypothetical protein